MNIKKNNLHKPWYWFYISRRVTYNEFINNTNLPWDYEGLSYNKNISINYIKNNLHVNTNVNLNDNLNGNLNEIWHWTYISRRVTYEEFINNIELPWNYHDLSDNKNIPISYIKNNLDKNWIWWRISMRVTYKEFIDNPDLPWDYRGISRNNFDHESRILAKEIMNVIINDEKYIAKVYNPNRMRSVKSICDLNQMKLDFGWTDEEFDKYVK